MKSLTNFDMADREILHVVIDAANGQGYAELEDITERLNLDSVYPSRNVSSRLSWMIKYGWVDHHQTHGYRLTRIGRDLLNGRLTKRLEASLEKMGHGERVALMQSLGASYKRVRDPVKTMMRRQWQHDIQRRQ